MPQQNRIVLIHGLWMTSLSWENWTARYAAQGYPVIAKSWPGMDVDIEELRRDPSPIATLGIAEIVDHYEQIVRSLDRPPFIIGHFWGDDHVCPASVVEANFKLYSKSRAVTEYRNFPGRTHFTLGQEGWEEVADCALAWAETKAGKYSASAARE